MSKSAPPSARLRMILGAVVFLLIVGAVGAMLVRSNDQPEPQVEPEPQPAPVVETPTIPLPPPPLERADLLNIAAEAAAAHSAGAPAPEAQAELSGRRFTVRIPFGCGGPRVGDEDDGSGWTFDDERRTIRISARPEDWTDTGFVREMGADQFESVEGLWLPRPWTATDACPPLRVDPLAGVRPAPSPQTVGLGQFFDAGASRVQQRGDRPWQATLRAEAEDEVLTAPAGFHLVIEGRLVAYSDGRPVRCQSGSPDQRPVCILRIERDYVAIADIESGEVIQEWRG